MKFKNSLFLLFLALTSSAQAITWAEYYAAHRDEVDDQIIRDTKLYLMGKNLTDINGLDKVPGIVRVKDLILSRNHLTALPGDMRLFGLEKLYLEDNQITSIGIDFFMWLPRLKKLDLANNQISVIPTHFFHSRNAQLRELYLYNNPIPLTQDQLAKEIGLPDNIELYFKTPEQELAEQALFAAIRNSDVQVVAKIIKCILDRDIRGLSYHISISKIRNANGDNLLHAVIREAAERLGVVEGMSVGVPEDEKKEVKAVQAEQRDEINDRYMKIIAAILACGEDCVNDMLFTPNAQGQQVIDAVFAKLGIGNPITRIILSVLSTEEEKKVTDEEKKNEAQK